MFLKYSCFFARQLNFPIFSENLLALILSSFFLSKTLFSILGRLVIVHAGSENGFVPNASLVFKAGQASGDYHSQMNQHNFMKWLEEKLLPNIPPNSVVVMDNAPYHSVQEDKLPTQSSLKQHMISWLEKKAIPHDPKSRKWELFELIQIHKTSNDEKKIVVDRVIRDHGHIPIRLPPYMCELNPIEIAWAQLKRFIRDKNTTGEFSIKMLRELVDQGIESITSDDWKKFCSHVLKIEDDFWTNDQYMEEVELLIITLNGDSSEDDTDFDSDSEASDKEN